MLNNTLTINKMARQRKPELEEERQSPVITSLLDLDHYKLTMGQFVFNRYPDVPVKYAFKNRTKVRLADIIDERDLKRELDAVQGLEATTPEINYLRTLKNNGKRLLSEDYLNFLGNLKLPDYNLKSKDGNFQIEFPGKWSEAIYWETLTLSIMNELYYRVLTKNFDKEQMSNLYQTGKQRLDEKIEILKQTPDIRYLEFGTRRRFSKAWQDYVVRRLKQETPGQMTGTSNVYLAMKYGLDPKGTMAHELFMIMPGIMHKNDDEIRASHNQVLKEWWDEYGYDLSIALTDTYGSDFFFKDMTKEQAEKWKGFRQDSGNPELFGNKQIKFYEEREIDPRKKLFVPSDGLDLEKIKGIQDKFRGRIIPVYGWGTNLTNDLGLDSLSIVVKAAEANGHGTVKLSDNPAKAMGSKEDVERFMRIFEYDPTKYEYVRCKY
ncbi:MAG: nicotinate phosphoribosyltransferase [Nanoarchaeota archaeon]|nr:nicotinate phosphoribosyltransferase [Nanoarchaeota archaeon]